MRARASGFVLIEASEVAGSAPPPSRRISGTMAFAALSPPRDVRCRAAAVLPCGARYRRRCQLRRSPGQSAPR